MLTLLHILFLCTYLCLHYFSFGSSRKDAVFALELAQSIHGQQINDTADVTLELYHYSSLSPFLIAKLELNKGVEVVAIKNPSASCIVDSLSMTRLTDVVLVEPSIVLMSQPMQQKKEKPVLSPKIICNRTSIEVGSVTSTSLMIDDDLKAFAKLQKDCKFQRLYSYRSSIQAGALVMQDILLNGSPVNLSSSYVGTMHTPGRYSYSLFSHLSTFAFMYPARSNIDWISNHDNGSLVCGGSESIFVDCTIDVHLQIELFLHRHRDWIRVLLLDRPIGLIAYDGGLVPQDGSTFTTDGMNEPRVCSSFNSLEGAKRSITAAGGDNKRIMLNIDLVMTLDRTNIAMHNNKEFGPIKFEQNSVQSISSMTLAEVQNTLRNPCIPRDLIRLWLDENTYHVYDTCRGCSQGVASAREFLDEIVMGYDIDIIFDLKAPHHSGQEIQAQQIVSMIHNESRSQADKQRLLERVKIRYFSVDRNEDLILEVLPKYVYDKISSGSFPSELKVYINAPSKVACLRLGQWARGKEIHLAGCFVIEGHIDVARSWQDISERNNIINTLRSTEDIQIICDVPRKQIQPDTNFWKNGLVSCVEDGYDWINYPFPVSSKADHSIPPSSVLTSIALDGSLMQTSLSSLNLEISKPQVASAWQEYVSHWGVASPFDWKPLRQHFSFVGEKEQNIAVQAVPNNSGDNIFRCVTKILTVMLFLRLEELGLLSIDDVINGLLYKVTWRQVFTNTAGIDGIHAGAEFHYSNSLWSHVSEFVQTITDVPFVEAVKYYILDPIGLTGSYDVNTLFPPFAARGFLGSNEDLLLIGSTLTSGGVSPKTRLRVISASSADTMLKDWTSAQNVTTSFRNDETVKSMKRFNYGGEMAFPVQVVDGYGMGLWRVKGWRTKGRELSPVRGWLAMGSSEAVMYFDTDDIVVAMCAPKQILGLELTAPFAKVVRDLGSRIDEAYLNQAIVHNTRGNLYLRGGAKALTQS